MEQVEQGLAIRGARLGKRMTQAHLAAMSGVSEKTVRRAEAGEGIRADSVRAICASLGLDAANLRSEAEMRPDVAAKLEAEMLRRAWVSRAAIGFLALAAVAGPLVAYYRDVLEMRALLGLLALPVFVAAPPACIVYLVWLTPAGRSFLAKLPGFVAAGRWLHRRRSPLMAVAGTAAFAVILPCLGLAIHDVVLHPGFSTGIDAAGMAITAAGCGWTIFSMVSENEVERRPGDGGKDRPVGMTQAQAT